MEKKKMLLMTGLSVSALAISLIVTLNDFGDKPTLADSNAQYSVTFNKSNTTYNTYNDRIIYSRSYSYDFEIACADAPLDPDNDLFLIKNEMSFASTLGSIWNIRNVVVNFIGEGHIQVAGDFKYSHYEENNRYGDRDMSYISDNNTFYPVVSGQECEFSSLHPKYDDNNSLADDYFYPNSVRLQGYSDAKNIRIQSITINYDCH